MENTNRNVFGIHGVTGMLIASVVLLSILCVLTYLGILAQQDAASKPYSLKNPETLMQNSSIKQQKEVFVIKGE